MSEIYSEEPEINIAKEVEELRQKLHRRIDDQCDALLQALVSGEPVPHQQKIIALSTPSHTLIGTKPDAVLYPNGDRVEVSSWRKLAAELLSSCNRDPLYHQRLMQLRNKVSGQQRMLLSDRPDGMDVPLQIDENLYFEGKFGTEMMLKVLTDKIFRPIGYDYSAVQVEISNTPHLHLDQKTATQKHDKNSLEDKIQLASAQAGESPLSTDANMKINCREDIVSVAEKILNRPLTVNETNEYEMSMQDYFDFLASEICVDDAAALDMFNETFYNKLQEMMRESHGVPQPNVKLHSSLSEQLHFAASRFEESNSFVDTKIKEPER